MSGNEATGRKPSPLGFHSFKATTLWLRAGKTRTYCPTWNRRSFAGAAINEDACVAIDGEGLFASVGIDFAAFDGHFGAVDLGDGSIDFAFAGAHVEDHKRRVVAVGSEPASAAGFEGHCGNGHDLPIKGDSLTFERLGNQVILPFTVSLNFELQSFIGLGHKDRVRAVLVGAAAAAIFRHLVFIEFSSGGFDHD